MYVHARRNIVSSIDCFK